MTGKVARNRAKGDMRAMQGRIAALYRHPVKGFTPEAIDVATLQAGGPFPCDRIYAVENGPSGFDPARPVFTPKRNFTVLASIPAVARARTRYDEARGVLSVEADGYAAFSGSLATAAGREGFVHWLQAFLDPEEQRGPLRVLEGPGGYRFMDDEDGAVSVLNLASVRDLEARLGRPVDPLRFRANILVEGWAPWAERSLAPGAALRLGEARLVLVKPIIRCAATHVDPATGERDIELTPALFEQYGRLDCGAYVRVAEGGVVRVGDRAESTSTSAPHELERLDAGHV